VCVASKPQPAAQSLQTAIVELLVSAIANSP